MIYTCKYAPLAGPPTTEPWYQNHHYDVMNRLISTCDLISWSYQIARGMNYLVFKKASVIPGISSQTQLIILKKHITGTPRGFGGTKCFAGRPRSCQSC